MPPCRIGSGGSRQITLSARSISISFTALAIQCGSARPYGGFIQQTPCQTWRSPSSSGEKKFPHLAFRAVAHTSSSHGPNLAFSSRNSGQESPNHVFTQKMHVHAFPQRSDSFSRPRVTICEILVFARISPERALRASSRAGALVKP